MLEMTLDNIQHLMPAGLYPELLLSAYSAATLNELCDSADEGSAATARMDAYMACTAYMNRAGQDGAAAVNAAVEFLVKAGYSDFEIREAAPWKPHLEWRVVEGEMKGVQASGNCGDEVLTYAIYESFWSDECLIGLRQQPRLAFPQPRTLAEAKRIAEADYVLRVGEFEKAKGQANTE